MKNMGVAGPDSSKDTEKSMDLPITYLLPSFSSTKSLQRKEKKKSSSLSLTNKLENFKEWKLNKKKKRTAALKRLENVRGTLNSSLNLFTVLN